MNLDPVMLSQCLESHKLIHSWDMTCASMGVLSIILIVYCERVLTPSLVDPVIYKWFLLNATSPTIMCLDDLVGTHSDSLGIIPRV